MRLTLVGWRAGELSSCQAVELSATSAAVDRMFGKSVCPDESIGSNTLQDHCKITARYFVAISFIAAYARPAWPKAIFSPQSSKMTSSEPKLTCPPGALIPVMKDSGASVFNDAVWLFVPSAVWLSGSAGGDRTHF